MAERKKTKLVVEFEYDPEGSPDLWSAIPEQPNHADTGKAKAWLRSQVAAHAFDVAKTPRVRIIRIVDEITVTVEQTPTVKFS